MSLDVDGMSQHKRLASNDEFSDKFEDKGIHRERGPGRRMNLLHRTVALGSQDVLHFHRFNYRERLTCFDLLPFRNRDRDDEPGHGAQEFLATISRRGDVHQPRGARFRLGEDIDGNFNPLMRQAEAVEYRADLNRNGLPVDSALPHGLPGLPWRDQEKRAARLAGPIEKKNSHCVAFACDVENDLVTVQPHRAATLAVYGAPAHLARNLSLALAEYVIDRCPDRRNPARDLAFGAPR
jgi:hypothetical protein